MKRTVTRIAVVLFLVLLMRVSPSGRTEVQFNPAHDCANCHGLHGGSGDALLNDLVVETLCLSCHAPGVTAAPDADVHHEDPNDSNNGQDYNFTVTCSECHVYHSNEINHAGTENLKLVKAEIQNPDNLQFYAVRFEALSGDYSFCDKGGPKGQPEFWDNVCDVCHSGVYAGRHYNPDYGSSQHHQSRGQCTNCHTHGQGFQVR